MTEVKLQVKCSGLLEHNFTYHSLVLKGHGVGKYKISFIYLNRVSFWIIVSMVEMDQNQWSSNIAPQRCLPFSFFPITWHIETRKISNTSMFGN